MGKGQKSRNRQLEVFSNPQEKFSGGLTGFCLPDTPDNRNLVQMITGKAPECFISEDGMLDSWHEKESTHKLATNPL